MINTVAQGVLGRNRSLSVEQVLRSARIWAWQRKYKPTSLIETLSNYQPVVEFLTLFMEWTWIVLLLLIKMNKLTAQCAGYQKPRNDSRQQCYEKGDV